MKTDARVVGLFPMVADFLHIGHLSALKEAHKYCDKLIVALNVDPTIDNKNKNKPIESVFERYYRLICCKYVDEVIPYIGELDLLKVIANTDYQVRFVGIDHLNNRTGEMMEEARHIECKCVTMDSCSRSSELRKRTYSAEKERIEKCQEKRNI